MLILIIIYTTLLQWGLTKHHAVTKHETLLIKEFATWDVVEYKDNIFKGWALDDIKQMLIPHSERWSQRPITKPLNAFNKGSFDSRTTRPQCVRKITTQGQCASSWAISVADSLADRFCVKGAKEAKDLSSQYLISCDNENYGCGGGYLFEGWIYSEGAGLVSESCFPYTSTDGSEPVCPTKCMNGEKLQKYKCKQGSVRELSYMTEDIKKEIEEHGSVSMSMVMYKDFMYYKSGVYKHVYGEDLGRQAVRAVGFGKEDGIPYWLCANSWGKLWGADGWFKIAIGEADIEGDVWACTPEIVSLSAME